MVSLCPPGRPCSPALPHVVWPLLCTSSYFQYHSPDSGSLLPGNALHLFLASLFGCLVPLPSVPSHHSLSTSSSPPTSKWLSHCVNSTSMMSPSCSSLHHPGCVPSLLMAHSASELPELHMQLVTFPELGPDWGTRQSSMAACYHGCQVQSLSITVSGSSPCTLSHLSGQERCFIWPGFWPCWTELTPSLSPSGPLLLHLEGTPFLTDFNVQRPHQLLRGGGSGHRSKNMGEKAI